ncbi:MAG: glycosyltransferase family 2 protein [Fibrobacterales bacterium]
MSILIAVPVYNRFKITHLCLNQLMKHKNPADKVLVYNDHSTEFDHNQLLPLVDEAVILPTKSLNGPATIRWHQMHTFLESDHEFLYATDNDGFHDPTFRETLMTLFTHVGSSKLPVSLYNSYYHNKPENIVLNKQGISLKKTAPGISMLYTRAMVEKIISSVDTAPHEHDSYDWDYRSCGYLAQLFVSSNTSYVEHFGFGGMHYSQENNDIAQNPTPYLQKYRQSILNYLQHDTPLPPELC